MPSGDLALQAESLPTETHFEASLLQEERSIGEEAEEEGMEVVETEGATEKIPTTPTTTEEDTLLTMASSAAKNPQSSRAIERTLRLSYLSGRSIRC
jgi:hypothetical protein